MSKFGGFRLTFWSVSLKSIWKRQKISHRFYIHSYILSESFFFDIYFTIIQIWMAWVPSLFVLFVSLTCRFKFFQILSLHNCISWFIFLFLENDYFIGARSLDPAGFSTVKLPGDSNSDTVKMSKYSTFKQKNERQWRDIAMIRLIIKILLFSWQISLVNF